MSGASLNFLMLRTTRRQNGATFRYILHPNAAFVMKRASDDLCLFSVGLFRVNILLTKNPIAGMPSIINGLNAVALKNLRLAWAAFKRRL